ncbi:hypothetical protein ACFRCG_41685 [Embleya sp. NPDC056575]|uniref:hypothetical protein n=1 Tax=unclassified Embleya TaxID=2699296 RepID=UPI003682499D
MTNHQVIRRELRRPGGPTLEHLVAWNKALIRCIEQHVPALLALVAEQAATIARYDTALIKATRDADQDDDGEPTREALIETITATDEERDRLEAALADAEHRVALAQRLARRDDYDLDVDLEGIVGDGLCGAADWDGDDRPPQWLVVRVVAIVRPHLARAMERAAGLVETVDALRRGSDRLDAEAERLFVERNEARAEVERLRADRDRMHLALARERHERAEAAEWPDDEPTAQEVVTITPDLSRWDATMQRFRDDAARRNATGAPESPADASTPSEGPTPAPDRS